MEVSSRREISQRSQFKALSWTTDRSVAQECFSDWSIQVKRGERTTTTGGSPGVGTTNCSYGAEIERSSIYYVHKVVLAVGPRHSEYFASLFRCDNVRERHDDTSVLQLSDAEADAMPVLLNFLYHGLEEFHLDESNESFIIGLCQLGQYLLVPALLSSLAIMCGKQLSLESLLNLTAELRNVVDDLEDFYDAAASLLLKQAPAFDTEIAHKIYPDLLIRAIHKTGDESFEIFNDQSILASMESFKDELTRDSFDFLSLGICTRNDPHLPPPPPVRGQTALRLLLLDAHISKRSNDMDQQYTLELSQLQEKCVEAITYSTYRHRMNNSYSFSLDYSPPDGAEEVLLRLPKNVLVAIISRFARNQEHGDVLRTVLEDKSLPSR